MTKAKKRSLAETHPELAKEWHPTMNGRLTPADVTSGSPGEVWWKCPKGDDHECPARIDSRVAGNGCAVCRGFRVVKSNCLRTTHPHVAKQWHATKNGDLTPEDVTSGSGRTVWWKCPKGDDHEWRAAICNRVKLVSKNPDSCPYCSNKRVAKSNCLETTHPELAKEWHPTENGDLTPRDVVAGSHRTVSWKCPKGDDHEWEAAIVSRTARGTGCSVCRGLKVVKSNCLETTHPELAAEWHPTKNKRLTARVVTAGSGKKVWWRCNICKREWRAIVHNRVRGAGCDRCALTDPSRIATQILFELKCVFPSIPTDEQLVSTDVRDYEVDIFIPEYRMVVEHDGKYPHRKLQDRDRKKTRGLERAGYSVLRIREKPLPRLRVNEIHYASGTKLKELVDRILTWIMNEVALSRRHRAAAKAYLSKGSLQNQKAFKRAWSRLLKKRLAGERGAKPLSQRAFAMAVLSDNPDMTVDEVVEAWEQLGKTRAFSKHTYYQARYDLGLTKKRTRRRKKSV